MAKDPRIDYKYYLKQASKPPKSFVYKAADNLQRERLTHIDFEECRDRSEPIICH